MEYLERINMSVEILRVYTHIEEEKTVKIGVTQYNGWVYSLIAFTYVYVINAYKLYNCKISSESVQ